MIAKITRDTSLIMRDQGSNEEKLAQLKLYHEELSPSLIEGLYNDLTPENAKQNFVIEWSIWDQVRAQARDQVWPKVRAQARDQVWPKVRAQAGDQVWPKVWAQARHQAWGQARAQVWGQGWGQAEAQDWGQAEAQVWGQAEAQVGDQAGDQVWTQVRDQVRAQVGDQVRAQVRADLEALFMNDDASVFDTVKIRETLKPSIEYALITNQLITLVMRYSSEMRALVNNATGTCAQLNLETLVIPQNTGDHFIDAQLVLLRKIQQAGL